jgi:activator of 2-hydroxyglutaryl-CoA dehydratase/predicted nucleotide-binding protein (sugar kinase/HSP70/actin superfamily)
VCVKCGNSIDLLDDSCSECGDAITDEMREAARQSYMQQKRIEREKLFPGLKRNREKRVKWLNGNTDHQRPNQHTPLKVGIDIGSKTVKIVVLDETGKTLYYFYDRHLSNVKQTLLYALKRTSVHCVGKQLQIAITGAAGIQFARLMGLPFIQEVLATKLAIERFAPDTDVAIELGGEDSKILFLKGSNEELRMNNTCAGGTGGFIDTIAGMLDLNAEDFNSLALGCSTVYPIASRCAVFAQSDVRPLLNEGVSRCDIAGSVFAAVATQCISGLACGRKMAGRVVLLGGPFNFLSALRNAFCKALGTTATSVEAPFEAHLFVAKGAALFAESSTRTMTIESLQAQLDATALTLDDSDERLPALFATEKEYTDFKVRHDLAVPEYGQLNGYEGRAFLGIDSGSTTIKCVLLGEEGQFLFSYYERVAGDLMAAVDLMLRKLYRSMPRLHDGRPAVQIAHTCVTGYGEDFLLKAFLADSGEVETVAHLRAARESLPGVDTVLDIGGQDIKYMTVHNGAINDIVLNEACSSGCGALIGGFAYSMNVKLNEFSDAALFAKRPIDLGMRCTVFMTSRVRHAQKVGASTGEISAGLAYSVVRNALFKVIRLHRPSDLGKRIVVQGGAFKSDAVLRAFEKLSGREVYRSGAAEYMGAYGAALLARERASSNHDARTALLPADALDNLRVKRSARRCESCHNHCILTISEFYDVEVKEPRQMMVGNRCTKPLGRAGINRSEAIDLFDYSYKRVFDYKSLDESEAVRGSIGILRALNSYSDYPLWHTFLTKLGYHVVLSDSSERSVYLRGIDTVISESVCYPAKISNGHLLNLIDKGLSKVFYPFVKYGHSGKLNCPVQANTPLVLGLNIEAVRAGRVTMVSPHLDYSNQEEVVHELFRVFSGLDKTITEEVVRTAFQAAINAYKVYKADIRKAGEQAVKAIERDSGHGVVVAGHAYHIDPELNHGLPEQLKSFGLSVLTAESVEHLANKMPPLYVDDRWEPSARIYRAAEFVTGCNCLDFIEVYSFGCGLDAMACDQARCILESKGKLYTSLKIDEMSDLAATRIRMRSMLAALDGGRRAVEGTNEPCLGNSNTGSQLNVGMEWLTRNPVDICQEFSGRGVQGGKTLCYSLVNWLPDYAKGLQGHFNSPDKYQGRIKALFQNGQETVLNGLSYSNSDCCYSAIYATGQVMAAVGNGDLPSSDTVILVPHTCAACRGGDIPGLVRKALKDSGSQQPRVLTMLDLLRDDASEILTEKCPAEVASSLVLHDLREQLKLRLRPYIDEQELSCFLKLVEMSDDPRGMLIEAARLLPLSVARKQRIALVGTAPTIYNPIINNQAIAQIEAEGCEVRLPWYSDFLLYVLATEKAGERLAQAVNSVRESIADSIFATTANSVPLVYPPKPLGQYLALVLDAGLATKHEVSGAGWLYIGHVLDNIENSIVNIAYLHSFGCLPAHTIGRGIFRELRFRYPDLNIVSIEYDPGASNVNQSNRLNLHTAIAKNNAIRR